MKNTLRIALLVAGSFGLGFLVGSNTTETYHFKRANDEIAEAKNYYAEKLDEYKANNIVWDVEDQEAASAALTSYQTGVVAKGFEPVDVNKIANEEPRGSYPLTLAEFNADESDYDGRTIMYYAGDDTLVDARSGTRVQDADREQIMGTYNDLLKRNEVWEDGSFYLRNDELRAVFEIIYDEDKSTDVLDESPGENE